MRCFARGHDDEGIVGRGVAINGDAIEGCIGQVSGQGWQQGRIDVGIGGQKTQHGGHVGPNHAGPFANASDGDRLTRQHHLRAESLGHGVGGHDAFSRLGPVLCLRIGNGSRHARHNAIDRQVFHDDARRERQDLLGLDFENCGQCFRSSTRVGQAFGTGARIGVARVDDQSSNVCIGL